MIEQIVLNNNVRVFVAGFRAFRFLLALLPFSVSAVVLPEAGCQCPIGLPFASARLIGGERGHYEEVTDMGSHHYRKLVFEGNLLVGTVLIGDVSDIGVLTSFIERRELFPKLKEEFQKDPYSRGLLSIRRRILCQH